MNRRRRKKHSRSLFSAILSGDTARAERALRAGADPEGADSDGTTPLYLASVNGEAAIAGLLLAAGAAPDTESSGLGSEGTPLCAAAAWGHAEAVRVLLAYGADPDLREDRGTGLSPLHWARHGGHVETAGILTAAGAASRTDIP
ncbi:ankyrin repeat domain-containing protein [Streptomyces sp. NPDC090108]|uniref:ankyrin repeat domain-containing protein n=1 Tax=Streptomyces sp. NPDC090108 TaxID=3365947 RepID=UPI00380DD653